VLRVDPDGVPEPLAATLRGYLAGLVADLEAGRRRVTERGVVVG